MAEPTRTQVLIIGGGPVGTGLAITLGQRGVDCTLVERHATPSPIPRGQNLTQRTMEHFHFWGVEKALRAARTIPPEYGIGGMTSYGTLLSPWHHDWLQRELVRPFYFTDNERLPQYATEAVLRRRAAELPTVRMLHGWSADALRQDADSVELTITDRGGQGHHVLRADYAVGCDGSRSLVREQAGITQTRDDHDRLMVLLVFRSPALHELLARYPGKSFYCVLHPELDGYWRFFGRVDLGSTFFFHAPVPPGTTRENMDFKRLLHAAVGTEFDIELQHVGFWDLRIAIADSYRAGRVFIAGDAAHSHPPYGGYGINTGFEDAVNLGWKLAASLEGWAGPHLLDSYGEERRPVFASTAQDFIERAIEVDRHFLRSYDPERDPVGFERAWNERRSGAKSEVGAFEPHYEGSPIVWGPQGGRSGALGRHAFTARPGHHLAPAALPGGRNVFEVLDGRFTLLCLKGLDQVASEFARAASRIGLPLQILSEDAPEVRDRYGAGYVLVRPDQFVAWAGDRLDPDATAILARSIGLAAM